jgi:hypothetical protein
MVDTAAPAPAPVEEHEEHFALPDLNDSIKDRWLVGAVAAITLLGAWLRAAGLSHGSLFRDDAWVALTHRVNFATAWKMVGTAPGFVLFERYWTGLTAWSTWWAQLPTFLLSILAIPLMVVICRWWGLSRWASLLAGALIALSRINVTYATHLKPYATDVIAGMVILAAAEKWRRGSTPWLFAVAAAVSFGISFTVVPVIIGCAIVLIAQGASTKRLFNLALPLGALAAGMAFLYVKAKDGISPRLKQSWEPNFFHYGSISQFGHSVKYVFTGLLWGFGDTTPGLHLPGYSKLFIAMVAVLVILSLFRINDSLLPLASVGAAIVLAAFQQVALGTGRTDAYLYPAIAIMMAVGAQVAYDFFHTKQRYVALAIVVVLALVVSFAAIDRTTHRIAYPGGSIDPVNVQSQIMLSRGGAVVVEGTARWPWTYYLEKDFKLVFSPLYNTGFAPVTPRPNVSIMRGTKIEGGYDPLLAIAKVRNYPMILYVRTDDWPALGDPMRAAFAASCFHATSVYHVPGYIMETMRKGACGP